jgi:hypothetical protein
LFYRYVLRAARRDAARPNSERSPDARRAIAA